jgi:ATP-dependent exoDNAse (exonuclease V) beta subunit
VLANVNRIADLARTYEIEGGISFRGFVEHLETQAKKSDAAEAPVVEEGAEGVRIMTVHAAKGLEFPVVILADLTANLAAREPERYVDGVHGLCAQRLLQASPWELLRHRDVEHQRERAEGVRVAYVAATRARDLLVVPVVGDEEREGWLEPLSKALYPAYDRRRIAALAEGCPAFGRATVLDRPLDLAANGEFSVHPGRHVPREGSHEVVWWDPKTLEFGVESSFGLRQEEVLAADGGRSLAAYKQWCDSREELLAAGRRPEFVVFTPSETASAPADFTCEVTTEAVARVADRPTGARFGALIHAVLRDVRIDGGIGEAAEAARMHGRLYGATEAEVEAAWEAAHGALRHGLLEQARSAAPPRVADDGPPGWHLDRGHHRSGFSERRSLDNCRFQDR